MDNTKGNVKLAPMGKRLQSLYDTATIADNRFITNMIASFSDYYSKRGSLTPRQEALVEKYEDFYDNNLIKIKDWRIDYAKDKESQKIFAMAISYYKANPPYFNRFVKEYYDSEHLSDQLYIPAYDVYEKMTSNRHFVSYLKEASTESKYLPGTLVEGRDNTEYSGCLYMVVRTTGKWRAARGSKQYLLFRITTPKYAKSWHQHANNIRYIEEKTIQAFKIKRPKTLGATMVLDS